MKTYDLLKERGFVYQLTDEKELPERINGKGVTFYVGFDPTGDSLHIGHLLPIMAMRWLQKGGHSPIALVGGATAQVGDPSGKTEMRKMLTKEEIESNTDKIKEQLSSFLNFTGDAKAMLVNNIDWLGDIKYIDFLRDVGKYFSINKMLTTESVKNRLETGLSFIEFNYTLLQAYDFVELMRNNDCEFQMGGQDQWGNIVAGTDLTRRILGRQGYGMTFPLLLNSSGQKFGKTVAGAVWLDPNKTSFYEYYQFWRNCDDADIKKLLGYFTELPMDEVSRLGSLTSPDINRAKEILAYEATKMVHGKEPAEKAYLAATAKFGFADKDGKIPTSSQITKIKKNDVTGDLPSFEVSPEELAKGIWVIKLFADCGLCKSNGDARRMLKQGALYINDERVSDISYEISEKDMLDKEILLRFGKKKYKRIILS
ncbi:MAG: tyrosine--tRNA ligase [Verrucomicrobiota bacterium]|nr:tyrosine--tRNA ligase [Verrucomicrobiota bacterium]